MESIVRAVNGALLQTCQLLGLPLVLKPHTTLNEKFNIHADIAINDTDIPHAQYMAIGNGGHRMKVGTGNIAYPEPLQHRPRDMALFNHLPFVLREPLNDLTATERSNYRLRRTETHNGVTYVAYYLKVLNLSKTLPQIEYRTVTDGVTTSTMFEATLGDMNPVAQDIPSTGVVTTTGDYIAATAKVTFDMDANDIAEFLNVVSVLYGDSNYAIISELALCSGVDRSVTGNFNGVSVGYTDAIAVQVVSFISEFYVAKSNNASISVAMDIGSVESMLNLQSAGG